MELKGVAIRLVRCRHFLTLTGLDARIEVGARVSGSPTQPCRGADWKVPTGTTLSALIDEGVETDASDPVASAVIRLFSIPDRLARGFREIDTRGQGWGADAEQSQQIPTLIADLTEFLDFIHAPLRGSYSVRLEIWPAQTQSASSPGADSTWIGARINVGEGRCRLVYFPNPIPIGSNEGKSLVPKDLVRVDLYPGEGYFSGSPQTWAWICPADGQPEPRILSLSPD